MMLMWPAEQNLAHPTFWNNQVKTRNNNSYLWPCHRANFKAISQSSCRDTAWNAHLIHEIRVMYIWTTGIIGCACTVCINYQKWAGPFMTVQTLPTSSPNFGVPLLLPLLLGSGAIAFQKYHPNVSMIGQFYVLLNSIPGLFCKATVGKISAALWSSMTLRLCTRFS